MQPDCLASLEELVALQDGAVSRAQVLACGLTNAAIRHRLQSGRWTPGLPGTYVTHVGPRTPGTTAWLGVLYAGPGASLSHQSAAFLDRLQDDEPPAVHVTVPTNRRVTRQPGLVLHRSSHLAARRHPLLMPPRTRLEHTVLDLVDAACEPGQVVGLLTASCQRRLTTAARLAAATADRKKLRWRGLVDEVLADVVDGVLSPLEREWAHRVERAHALPRGRRNVVERSGRGRVYRDVEYLGGLLVVELDGRAAHPEELRHRDLARDNELLVARDVRTLRYGWHAVRREACGCAAQVAAVLTALGWAGRPLRCGPGCSAT